MQQARDLYKDESAGAGTSKEKQVLANKILQKAEQTEDDPGGAYALFCLAREIAVAAVDAERALQIVDAMAERYEVDALGAKGGVLLELAKSTADHAALTEEALDLADAAVDGERYELAARLSKLALVEAGRAGQSQVQQDAKAFADYVAARAALADKPNDRAANFRAGAYLCFVKGDWEKGLPYLSKGSNERLKKPAERERSKPPATVAAQVELADAWWSAGRAMNDRAKRDAILVHAGDWYRLVKPGLTGADEAKRVEERLKEVDAIPAQQPAAASYARGSLLPRITFGKWFPLLTLPNTLIGWDTTGTDFTYANRVIEIRNTYAFYPLAVRDVGIRTRAKKLPGQCICLALRYSDGGHYTAWFNGGREFGIGKSTDNRYVDLKVDTSPRPHDDWFEFGFTAVGDALTLSVDGQPVVQVREPTYAPGRLAIGAYNGAGLFSDVELLIPNKASLVADKRKPPPGKADDHPLIRRVPSGRKPAPAVAPFNEAQAKEHQKHWAKYLKVPVEQTNSIGMTLVLIPPGSFMMGDANSRPNMKPAHQVTITKPFFMGKYEVTQEQWEAVTGNNPCAIKGAKLPVNAVNWDYCQAFIKKLNEKFAGSGVTFSLPTEEQWEYACRAGGVGRYGYGDDELSLSDYAWFSGNSGNQPHPGGEKKPNAWGLYDMHGNVAELCGPPPVACGGSWGDPASGCGAASRNPFSASLRVHGFGLRIVCVLEGPQRTASGGSLRTDKTVYLDDLEPTGPVLVLAQLGKHGEGIQKGVKLRREGGRPLALVVYPSVSQ